VIFVPLTVVKSLSYGHCKRTLFMMAEQLRGPFEKFVDSPCSKKGPSPHLHKVATESNKVRTHDRNSNSNDGYRDEDHATTTFHPPLQLGVTVTASLCIPLAHCRQSTNFANSPRMYRTHGAPLFMFSAGGSREVFVMQKFFIQ
jgi:hypothetical protein